MADEFEDLNRRLSQVLGLPPGTVRATFIMEHGKAPVITAEYYPLAGMQRLLTVRLAVVELECPHLRYHLMTRPGETDFAMCDDCGEEFNPMLER